jgi:pimeloyl-ACP methyl ester carboxylesterase
VVLIHGVPGTVRDFRWLAPCVYDHLRVIRFDMPGFGHTPLSSGLGFDVVDRANFVVALLDALKLERAAIVGHSMGAAVAVAVAVHHAPRVSHVGLLASPGLRPHRKFRNTFPVPVARAMRLPIAGGMMRRIVKRGFSREGFPAAMGGADIQTVMNYAAGLGFSAHRRRILALSCPTLVAYSDDDHLIETEICAALAASCPAGPRAAFSTGSHNLQKNQAIALGEMLVDWLK